MTKAFQRLLLIWILLLANISYTQDESGVRVTPRNLSGMVCSDECYTQTLTIDLPALDIDTIDGMDIVFLLDISGSMGDVLNSVRNNTSTIAEGLRDLVPDTRFGLGVFSDYDDVPWDKVSDLQTDLSSFDAALARVTLETGGDTPESQVRALHETLSYDWRDEALKIVVVFTDAPPHRTDVGPDERSGTEDDLEFEVVLSNYMTEQIRIIGVNSGSNRAAASALQEAVDATDGSYFRLSEADTIPETIVEQVTGIIASLRMSFKIVDERYEDWIEQSPRSFRYPSDGGTQTVEITICPGEHTDEAMTLNTALELSDANIVYDNVSLALEYAPHCVLLNIADTANDDALSCNTDEVFWESPAIVIRPDDSEERTTITPITNQTNNVYVQVRNLGVRQADATVILYSTDDLNISASDWQPIGETPITIDANSDQWVGPFSWTPQGDRLALRAEVSSADDEMTAPDNYVCEGQIAQHNLLNFTLPVYTLRPGFASNVLPAFIVDSLLDGDQLRFNASDLQADDQVVRPDGDFLDDGDTVSLNDMAQTYISARDSDTLGMALLRDGIPIEGVTLLLDYDTSALNDGTTITVSDDAEDISLLSTTSALILTGVLVVIFVLAVIVGSLRRNN